MIIIIVYQRALYSALDVYIDFRETVYHHHREKGGFASMLFAHCLTTEKF